MHLELKNDDVGDVINAEIGEITSVQIDVAIESPQESFSTSCNKPSVTMVEHATTFARSQTLQKAFASEPKCQLDIILSDVEANGAVETNLAFYPEVKVKHSVKFPKHLDTRTHKLTKASSFGSMSTFTAREKIKAIVEMMESINASTICTKSNCNK